MDLFWAIIPVKEPFVRLTREALPIVDVWAKARQKLARLTIRN